MLMVLDEMCGRLICGMAPRPAPQVRFETGAPAGLPHVPAWPKARASAASGATTSPAVTRPEASNINGLAGIQASFAVKSMRKDVHAPCQPKTMPPPEMGRRTKAGAARIRPATSDEFRPRLAASKSRFIVSYCRKGNLEFLQQQAMRGVTAKHSMEELMTTS